MKYENHKLHDVCYMSKATDRTTKMVTVLNSVLKRRLRILTNKHHYKTEITFNWSNVMSCTLHGLKADKVQFMNISQHKRFVFVNWTVWRYDYIIAME